MAQKKGLIVLMGSGELTSTMVEVHKEILGRKGGAGKAVFLDTPAGFQLNADELSQRAVEYFRINVQHPMSIASLKSREISPLEAEEAYHLLREADYLLVGPGSPTYAVRQWLDTPVPDIIRGRIEGGGCFVAASAAALTVGRFTMPVYEIYKVGEAPAWQEGMNILGHFGLNYVVIPHWNNAEGGTHDTRCCFIGEARFSRLEALLPENIGVLGIDEHTACILDLEEGMVEVRGIGGLTLRKGSSELVFTQGEKFPVAVLLGTETGESLERKKTTRMTQEASGVVKEDGFWDTLRAAERTFHENIETDPKEATNSVLEIDRTVWKAKQDLENEEFITQGREVLRELIVLLGMRLSSSPGSREECLAPLVDKLVSLRRMFREKRQWEEADLIRSCLKDSGIVIEDAEEGTRWSFIA
jgi:cyanophycinase-like exopeptidase